MGTTDTFKPGKPRESMQVLVLADTWCDAKAACDAVLQTIGERTADVLVVSPALTGRLHSLVSDIDRELAVAERRLESVLAELRSHGFNATGRVGDENPLLAIKDALYQFAADEIVIVTTEPTEENWRERHLFQKTNALGSPVSCVRVAAVRA
jgi:hypothetical protein